MHRHACPLGRTEQNASIAQLPPVCDAGGTAAAFGNIVPSRKAQAAKPEQLIKPTETSGDATSTSSDNTREEKEQAKPPAEQESAHPPPDTGPEAAKPHRVLGREGVMKMTRALHVISFPLF